MLGTPVDEREARIDLAAAHRLAELWGWTNLNYNHITVRVPGEPGHFLLKPHDLLYDEVTASNLLKLDLQGNAVGDAPAINAAGFNIHTAILAARPEINVTIHVHTDAGIALSCLKGGLRFLNQTSMRFFDRIGHHAYEGIADAAEEQAAIVRDLGPHRAMILRSHGLLACGEHVHEAMMKMRYLIQSCATQMMIDASRDTAIEPAPELCEAVARGFDKYDRTQSRADWAPLIRMLDRRDPSYRD
jgi:ribulose-5-phosphate 4-epimerase/fuculose-1-phosphate aldolase